MMQLTRESTKEISINKLKTCILLLAIVPFQRPIGVLFTHQGRIDLIITVMEVHTVEVDSNKD